MKGQIFIAAVALLSATAVAFGGPRKKASATAPTASSPTAARTTASAPAATRTSARRTAPFAYSPAGTVAFANLETIAQTVRGIAPGVKDPLLTYTLPNAIRRQGAALLFGAMRPGAHGVAVCYVEPTIAARVAKAKKPSDADLDRMKRWSVVYPTALTRDLFLRRHPECVADAGNTLRVPPGNHSKRTLWAWFAPDGQWAVLAPSPAMAANAYAFSASARQRPLGSDLAYVQLSATGAQVVFGADVLAGGTMSVRMGRNGLELRGSGHFGSRVRRPLPAGAKSFAGIPAAAPLFGVTTTPSDVHFVEGLFAMGGPAFTTYVKQSLRFIAGAGASGYYLDGTGAQGTGLPPATRLDRILPEAKTVPSAANVMFCSPTTVMRLSLPKVAAKMMPFESAKLQVALRMLRSVRGDGMGVMGWREGTEDQFFIRISRDELWGTSNLWSTLLL